jgi:hypothetical protein
MSDDPIQTITAEELVRFYQIYMITKDTQSHQPVTRVLSVDTRVVQLSAIFLAVCVCTALLIGVGLARYALFRVLHRTKHRAPHTKLDWLLQTLKSQLPEGVIVMSGRGDTKRQRFQAARYGLQEAGRADEQAAWMKSPTFSVDSVENNGLLRGQSFSP